MGPTPMVMPLRAGTAGAVPPPPGAAHRWTDAAGEVDYAVTPGCWIAAAPPRAAPQHRVAVARRFMASARQRGCRVVWFGVDARFVTQLQLTGLRIGAEPWWRADRWPATLAASTSLRAQLRRAGNKGVQVRAATAAELDADLRARLEQLQQRWAELHELPPMQFLCRLDPARSDQGRTLWLAEVDTRLVGCAGVIRTGGDATVITELLRDPSAPNGTTELLFDAVQRQAATTAHGRVTLGLAPLHGEVGRLLNAVRIAMRHHYDFTGVCHYKRKLQPHHWRDQWLAYEPGLSSVRALLAVARAFAGGSLLRYAARSVLRSLRRVWTGRKPR